MDMCGGYRGAKQRVVALKVCAVFGTTADTTHLLPCPIPLCDVSPSSSLSLPPYDDHNDGSLSRVFAGHSSHLHRQHLRSGRLPLAGHVLRRCGAACMFRYRGVHRAATPSTGHTPFQYSFNTSYQVMFRHPLTHPANASSQHILPTKVSSSLSLVVFNLFGYCLSLVLSGYLMQVGQINAMYISM